MLSFDFKHIRQSLFRGLVDMKIYLAIPAVGVLTFLLAQSGIDAWVNDVARLQNSNFSVAWSAFPMIAGMVMPFIIPMVFAYFGEKKLANASLAAFLIAITIVSLLKGFTSRVHPEELEPATTLLRSQAFRFGFLQNGFLSLVEGWPSGHTITNGAVGFTIARLANKSWIKTAAIIWVVWVVLATIFGISGDVHWLSDTLAGLILALVIVIGVTREFDAKRLAGMT